jgi:hypothetical protein
MRGEIPESDWKLLRKFHESALERYCEASIEAIGHLCIGTPSKFHDRYLEIYALVDERNEELGSIFDNMLRRSVAIGHILTLRSFNLMTDEEFSQFSIETQTHINLILEDRKALRS